MDYNNINERIERIYSALNARFDNDIEKRISLQKKEINGIVEINMSINEISEADTINKEMAIIENLAKLKDHIKNIISQNNGNPKIIETEINQSDELQILIDIYNTDKHGYPLTHPERSNKSPKIINIKSVLQQSLQAGTTSSFVGFSMGMNGQIQTHGGGEHKVVIIADIVDKNGNHLYSIDKFIDKTLFQWEKIIEKYKCA